MAQLIRRSAILISSCIVLAVSALNAQWTKDPSQNAPISVGNTEAEEPVMAPDGNGGAYFVWNDKRSGDNPRVYCQHVDANGNALWAAGGIAVSSAAGPQFDNHVAADGAGGVFVAWQGSADTNTSRADVFAQRIGSDGTLMWGAAGKDITQSGQFDILSTAYVALVADGAGGIYLAWDENICISIGRVNGAGSVMWKKAVTPLSTTEARLIRSGDGGAIITYEDARGVFSGDLGNVFAQKVDSAGTILWGAEGMPACNQGGQQDSPQITSDGGDGAIVAWQDFRNNSVYKIRAMHLNGAGNPVWINGSDSTGFEITTNTDGQTDISMAATGDGGAAFTWNDNRRDMYAQKLNANGSRAWGAAGLALTSLAFGVTEFPQLAADGSGGAVVVWADTRNIGSGEDIYTQRVNAAGSVQWTAGGVQVTSAPHHQSDPFIIADGKGDYISTWYDPRITNSGEKYDIFAQKISGGGSLLDVRADSRTVPAAIALVRNYPNPFNPSTMIEFTPDQTGDASVTVYSVLGEKVATLFEGRVTAGERHQVRLDASALASGPYYCLMQAGGSVHTRAMLLSK